jgi:hypothetical protein
MYHKNDTTIIKGFTVKKYGFWGAKLLAEAERRRIYPHWRSSFER